MAIYRHILSFMDIYHIYCLAIVGIVDVRPVKKLFYAYMGEENIDTEFGEYNDKFA